MKYSNLEIKPLPKRFEVWHALDVMQRTMLSERKRYLKKKLQTKEQFTMEGLLVHYDIETAIEQASRLSEEEMIERLQREFVEKQWAEE